MKTVVYLVIIGWVAAAGYSQAMPAKDGSWNKGKLELVSGTVLDGELNYNWKAEVVQLRLANGTVKAYSASQINRFIYFDNEHDTVRTFASVDFPITPTLERRLILEEYVDGPLTIYRRLRHQHEPIRMGNPAQYGADALVYDDLDSFVYYIYSDESVIELSRFERDLWPRMKDEFGPQLNHYRISQHLDINTTLAKLLLINQYNALKSDSLAASAPSEVSIGNQEKRIQ